MYIHPLGLGTTYTLPPTSASRRRTWGAATAARSNVPPARTSTSLQHHPIRSFGVCVSSHTAPSPSTCPNCRFEGCPSCTSTPARPVVNVPSTSASLCQVLGRVCRSIFGTIYMYRQCVLRRSHTPCCLLTRCAFTNRLSSLADVSLPSNTQRRRLPGSSARIHPRSESPQKLPFRAGPRPSRQATYFRSLLF